MAKLELSKRVPNLRTGSTHMATVVPRNLALNKPALQSSTCEWSNHRVPELDARGANNGTISPEAGFHTATEQDPWWQVDLQDKFLVEKVAIFNRQHMAERLTYFSLLLSLDGMKWASVFTKRDESVFGKSDHSPYVIELPRARLARFLRLRLNGRNCLHFNELQAFGRTS
jgi:hypothetical protein